MPEQVMYFTVAAVRPAFMGKRVWLCLRMIIF